MEKPFRQQCIEYLQKNGPTQGSVVMKALGKAGMSGHAYMKGYTELVCEDVYGVKLWRVKDDVPTFTAPEAPKPAPELSSLDGAIVKLVDALVARITTDVQDRVEALVAESVEPKLVSMIERMTANVGKVTAIPVSATKTKLPRVLVIGLLPEQQHMIAKEFSEVLDTRFVGSNDNVNMMKSNASQAVKVFIMADFISHSSVAAVQSVGADVTVVKGGMTHLRDALTAFYVEGTH